MNENFQGNCASPVPHRVQHRAEKKKRNKEKKGRREGEMNMEKKMGQGNNPRKYQYLRIMQKNKPTKEPTKENVSCNATESPKAVLLNYRIGTFHTHTKRGRTMKNTTENLIKILCKPGRCGSVD